MLLRYFNSNTIAILCEAYPGGSPTPTTPTRVLGLRSGMDNSETKTNDYYLVAHKQEVEETTRGLHEINGATVLPSSCRRKDSHQLSTLCFRRLQKLQRLGRTVFVVKLVTSCKYDSERERKLPKPSAGRES